MKINNAGELSSFIENNGLLHIAAELPALTVCIEEYGRMCGGCVDVNIKNSQAAKCRALYINFVSSVSSHKSILLSKTTEGYITFTDNGQLLTTIRR
jgi:hypothetical protein